MKIDLNVGNFTIFNSYKRSNITCPNHKLTYDEVGDQRQLMMRTLMMSLIACYHSSYSIIITIR